MTNKKNHITLTLMTSSIILLFVLQGFWLHGSYEKAFYDLRRETNSLFRSTVMALRDSMVLRNIQPISYDTLLKAYNPVVKKKSDSLTIRFSVPDSIKRKIRREESSQIFISTIEPVDEDALKPIISGIQSIHVNTQVSGQKGEGRGFMIRINPDTLNLDTLSVLYKTALVQAQLEAPFKIRRLAFRMTGTDPGRAFYRDPFSASPENPKRLNIYRDTIVSDVVRVNPLQHYTASVGNVRKLVFREITPQILFSIFLTLITTVAFVSMYRNIRAQQKLMEAKNDFINNVSHELKTPVATVSVVLEALKNFRALDDPKLTQEYLDIAQRELNRLSLMTDKILRTSVFEQKGVEFEAESLDVNEIIAQILASMKVLFEKKQAQVVYETEGDDFRMTGGTLHLTNVIYNLIDNALKYSIGSPVITITLKRLPSALQLTVRDQGIGIAPEYHANIFEKFFRVPSGDVHNTQGYGLGLSYVASVVRSHGGRIELQSEPGKGSAFIITLPVE